MDKKLIAKIIAGAVTLVPMAVMVLLNFGISQFRIANLICGGISVCGVVALFIIQRLK
jgi:hypothetical protein